MFSVVMLCESRPAPQVGSSGAVPSAPAGPEKLQWFLRRVLLSVEDGHRTHARGFSYHTEAV